MLSMLCEQTFLYGRSIDPFFFRDVLHVTSALLAMKRDVPFKGAAGRSLRRFGRGRV